MPVYFEYLLKASLSLAVIFLFYNFLLKRMTHYVWNRYFLMVFSILSFVVPFININVFVPTQELNSLPIVGNVPSVYAYSTTELSTASNTFDFWQLISIVFLVVSFALLSRLMIQLYSIKKIKSKATLAASGDVKIYQLSDPILPFSFLDSIFINPDKHSEDDLQEIVHHEQVHVEQRHTIDVLIAEAICILNWYNPFAWLIKKAVRENLEFIADDEVIKKGINKKNYQYLLLKVTGDTPLSITSSLTFSSLKNRIVMMNKTKTSGIHLFKFILLIPVIAILLLAFRNQKDIAQDKEKVAQTETFTLSALTYVIPDKKVESIVISNKDQSFLKTGEVLNLSLVSREKNRLQNLLQRNGYNNLNSNAIRFMIDTTAADNSFSVEVNINVQTQSVTNSDKIVKQFNATLDAASTLQEQLKTKPKTYTPKHWEETKMYPYLEQNNKKGC